MRKRRPFKKPAARAAPAAAPVRDFWICLALAGLVLAVFSQAAHFQFLNYDDDRYVTANVHVRAGLRPGAILWVLTHLDIHLWSPVTSLSHMLDCQLFGLDAGWHHLVNVLIHAAGAVLLYLALRDLAGAPWRAAFVAAIFAVHPLRVESVAWVAERKDVLDGFFFALMLGAYARFARDPGSRRRYFLVILWFALGMLAKPMLVTAPALLLLLDYWPLGRIRGQRAGQPPGAAPPQEIGTLLLEKAPLALLGAGVVAATLFSHEHHAAEALDAPLPLPARLANGAVAALVYIRQMAWPADTGLIRGGFGQVAPMGDVALAVAALVAISIATVINGKKRPWLPVGWFWYLGMLVPVSGVTPLGFETRADRYTYLPQIGLAMILAWGVAGAAARLPRRRVLLGSAMAATIAALAIVAATQAAYWRDPVTLWRHVLANTGGNVIAQENLAAVLLDSGQPAEALTHYRAAIALAPGSGGLRQALAAALMQQGRLDEAIGEYRAATALAPRDPVIHDNLATALTRNGRPEQALAECKTALALDPSDPFAHGCMAAALDALGRVGEAETEYRAAIARDPSQAGTHNGLALDLLKRGRADLAAPQFEASLALDPHDTDAANDLAMILAAAPDPALRNGTRAMALAGMAVSQTRGADPLVLSTLAAAYAECGRFPDAIVTASRAIARADSEDLASLFRTQLAGYRENKPLRDPSLLRR